MSKSLMADASRSTLRTPGPVEAEAEEVSPFCKPPCFSDSHIKVVMEEDNPVEAAATEATAAAGVEGTSRDMEDMEVAEEGTSKGMGEEGTGASTEEFFV
jgi:hypothetical protein